MKTTVLTFCLGCVDDGYPLSFITLANDIMECPVCLRQYKLGDLVKLVPPDLVNTINGGEATA